METWKIETKVLKLNITATESSTKRNQTKYSETRKSGAKGKKGHSRK